MLCLGCQQIILDNIEECPFCHTKYTAEKLRFIKYLGDTKSLVGYQKSYKLVLLKIIFECVQANQELSVDNIMYKIKDFYLERIHNGFVPDYEVDERIKNISEKTTIYDIWAVFKANPYNAINNQGFLFLEKNGRGELVFVLSEDLNNITDKECATILEIIEKKIELYYSRCENDDSEFENNTNNISQIEFIPQSLTTNDDDFILIENTRLSVRSKNCLKIGGYKTIHDILYISEDELFNIPNMGRKSVKETLDLINDFNNGIQIIDESAIIKNKQILDGDNAGILQIFIKNTELSNRAKNALISAGYQTLGDIIFLTEPELCELNAIGANTVEEIFSYLVKIKKKLATEIDENGSYAYYAIDFPYASIHHECDKIPVNVLTYFGMQPSLIKKLLEQSIFTLQHLKCMDYSQIQIAMGSDWIKLLHFTLQEFYDGAVVATKAFLDKISQQENLKFIVERCHGATLQELGDNYGITREGVRQKIEKPLKSIKPMAVCLTQALIDKLQVKYLTLQDVYDVYDNDDYDAILEFALKESEEIECVDSLGLFFIKTNTLYNKKLSSIVAEYVGDGVFWQQHLDMLAEILQENNMSFLNLDDIWIYMLSQGYKVYGEYVVPHTVSYGVLLALVIDEKFPQGISFSNEQEVEKLRYYTKEKFGDLNLPEDDRPLSARVIDLLVLCDRGKWISPNRISIDLSMLETIKNFIDTSVENIIYYQALFNQFEGLISMMSDISNYHYLHGVLKYYYGSEYVFNRDYLQKGSGNVAGRLENRIYDYIISKGQAVSKSELKEHLKITSDAMISNIIFADNNIFQWEYNYYNCSGNIKVEPSEKDFLCDIIDELFQENSNYCSAKMVFESCKTLIPEIIIRNNVQNPTNLFYLIANLLSDKYKFRVPHILPIDSTISTTDEIVRHFLQKPKILKWDNFLTMVDKFGWGQSTAAMIFDSIAKEDYFRISRTDYILKNEFSISKENTELICEKMNEHFSTKDYLGIWEIDFRDYPNLGYKWTVHLLATVVESYITDYRLVTPNYGSNKIERGLFVRVESNMKTFDEIVVDLMKKQGHTNITESEMYTMLVISGIIKHSVPNELKESMLLEFKDGIYKIKGSA